MKMLKGLKLATLVCVMTAGSSPTRESQAPDVGQPELSMFTYGHQHLLCLHSSRLIQERPTVVLSGSVTVLYQIIEELTLGRNCERSFSDV